MARRNQSVLDDVIEITMMLPWWVGVLLAVVSYLGLHWYAGTPVPASVNPKNVSEVVSGQMLRAFAKAGRYFLPMVFLLGAGLSVFKAHKRRVLHDRVATQGDRQSLEKISWLEFEHIVGEYFRRKGYAVEETGGGGADGGVDLVVSLGKDRYFVQCKQWKSRQVGVATVRELYGVMAAEGAAGGFVVTSGAFTEEAQRFAAGREIKVIAGEQLLAEMRRKSLNKSAQEKPTSSTTTPACPQCGAAMVLRAARKGANAGSSFWGCPQYPKCRGTRPA
jgi:restriction system protein